jgi:SAM-dependent methyltransferase
MTEARRRGGPGSQQLRGGAFYDRPGVLERYRQRPPGVSSPNRVMERPALLQELGSVRGLRVVDLGCGDGGLGHDLLDAGAASYLGIDGSERMVRTARGTIHGRAGNVVLGDIEDFAAAARSVDLVVSCSALHYVADLAPVLHACHEALVPGGRLALSVVHPVITCNDASAGTPGLRTDWLVDDYFVPGPRSRRWLGSDVVWHHRTVEDYVSAMSRAGFTLTALRECAPQRERFDDDAEFARRRRVPLFLLLVGQRASPG